MKRLFLVLGMVAAGSLVLAQKPQASRVSQIWAATEERLTRQNDYWFDKGEFPRAVQLLKFHYEIDKKNGEIATNLGWMLENIEQKDAALAIYIDYRKQNPGNPDAAWPEANFYFRGRAYAKVPPLLEPTLKKRPHPNSYRTLAHSYDRLNMLSDSKRVWELLVAHHPQDSAAKVNLQRVLKKLNEGSAKKT